VLQRKQKIVVVVIGMCGGHRRHRQTDRHRCRRQRRKRPP
jgi:hypothetical protein